MNATPEEVRNDIVYQAGALKAFTSNRYLQHVKPHGAMYNQAVDDADLGKSICEAVLEIDSDIILLALAGSTWIEVAKKMGMRVAREVFADRAVHSDGTLVPRSIEGAVIHDINEVVERSLQMVTEGKIVSVEGDMVEVEADSICLHGDTPGAVDMAKTLKKKFLDSGVEVIRLSDIV